MGKIEDNQTFHQRNKVHMFAITSLGLIPEDKGDLYRCLKPLLCIGRLLGLVPISGIFNDDLSNLSFKIKSFASITSLSIIGFLSLYNALALVSFLGTKENNASEIVINLSEFVFAGIGLYVYIFMYKNSSKLISLFHKWRQTKTFFHKMDLHLFRNVVIISCVIFSTGLIENVASHWKFFKAILIDKIKKSRSEIFMQELFSLYTNIITPNTAIALTLFVGDKLLVFAWTFGDVFIIAMALAISNRFKFLYEDFKEKIESKKISSEDPSNWSRLCKDHAALCDLLMTVNDLLSPLIFACVFANVYFVSLELNYFLLPNDNDVIKNIYDAYAFATFLLRNFMAITCSAKVNHYAHKIVRLFEQCSSSALTKEVERTELKLRTSPIGFQGLNCFTITNSFILSVVNVVFTVEIVLLQSSAIQTNSTINGH